MELLSGTARKMGFALMQAHLDTCGAGFPGLPLKILRPRLDLTLLEATGNTVGQSFICAIQSLFSTLIFLIS